MIYRKPTLNMPQKAKNASSIPLFCLICPKKTPFSDISHLLTHISSKSHLSCRFKIQLKAANDLEAKVKLDEFEDWYATYNMGKLLSERMNAKDIKKGGKLVVSKVIMLLDHELSTSHETIGEGKQPY
jgi:hypothetical protein